MYFSTQEALRENGATAASIAIALRVLGLVVIPMLKPLLYSSLTMFSTQEAFIENRVTTVFIVFIAIPLLVLGLVVILLLCIGVKHFPLTMFSTQEAFIENGASAVSNVFIAIALLFHGHLVISIGVKLFPFLRRVLQTMFSTQEAFRENGATAVSIASIAIALLFLGLVVIPMLSIGVKLLLLSLLWVALYYLQSFLVGKRRCSRDWYVQYTAMAAYYLPTPVALCAASALYHFTSSHIDEYTPILVASIVSMLFFTIFFSTQPGLLATNMSAYSLGDRRRNRSDLLMWLVFLGSIDWEWCWTTGPNWRGLLLLSHMSLLCLTAYYILFSKPAESTLDCQTKVVADYMKRRKSSKSSSTSSPFFDANSNNSLQLLDCCRYPFEIGKGKEGEWITVQDLFDQCDDRSDGDKEICLSYSLSRLLFLGSLGDRRRNRSDLLMWLVFLGSIDLEWCWTTGPNWRVPQLLSHVGALCVTAHYILFDKPPYSTLDCLAKIVAYYMKWESSNTSSSSPFFDVKSDDDNDDANSICSLQLLDYCKYPFVIGKEGEWITVQDLFDQCGNLSDGDKEICLSYSLSRLLARRYYGFHCAEEGDDIVRRFVLADLQPTDDGYDRAFRIVEVQLAFLHDYFFTASFTNIKSGFKYIIAMSLILSVGFGFIIFIFLQAIETQNEQVYMIQMFLGTVLCICLSSCAVFGTPMSLLVKNLVASYWRPINTAFRNLKCFSDVPLPAITCLVRLFCSSPNAQDDFDPFQTEAGGAYWSNKLGQYSILQDFNRHRSLKKEIVAWFKGTILSEPSYKFIKHLPVEDEEVDIKNLDSMRKLIADTLWDIDGPPTNGTKSLKTNLDSSVYDWLWTCRQETHTHTILIWHIATCYCDMSLRHSDRPEFLPETETFHKVATALSRYCAYLVAFLPEFLSEHSLITKEVFQRVLQEAKDALGSTHMEEKEKYTKIAVELPHPDEQTTTFHKGVWLGQQLVKKLDVERHWKVMAEFWAETILYIAPSDNAEAHIEHLAKGGEFITHLWAMLSNAGILKRATGEWHPPPASTTTRELCSSCSGPLTQTEISNVHSNEKAPAPSKISPPRQSSKYTVEEKGKQPEIQIRISKV